MSKHEVAVAFAALALMAGNAPAQVLDLSGTWQIQATVASPGEGSLDCTFEGTADLDQNGTDLSGPASMTLVNGTGGCPPELGAALTGTATDTGVEMGALMDAQLGDAFFDGQAVLPGSIVPPDLVGTVGVETGPFAGLSGTWSAQFQGGGQLPIPTLGVVGLAVLALLLLLAATRLLGRRPQAA